MYIDIIQIYTYIITKICKIYKTLKSTLQLYILINSIRRWHMPKRHAKRRTHLLLVLLPNLMRLKISVL